MAAALETVTGERLRPVYVLLDGEAAPDAAPEAEKVDRRGARRAAEERVRRGGGQLGGARWMPGGFDVNALMKQAQQMQSEMLQAQEQLKDEVVEASAGGGMVKVKMGGDLTLREITIDPEAIDPEEAELLAEMVQAAVNEALRAAQELACSKMGGITGGLGGLPGM